jgi:DNA-binding MarR family transcriptional regulator/GNAT superfamily N-acetyltransferase
MVANRIRAFNRFYTHKIGLITNRFLDSEFSLVQARFLFELDHNAPLYAADLSRKLGLSPDYMSKLISRFESMGLIRRTPSPQDGRKQFMELTPEGKRAYENLKEKTNSHIERMIRRLAPEEINRLIGAMDTIEQLLEPDKKSPNMVTIRSHRPGDIGYVIHRHGVLYAREYGFNHEFDAYVALGTAKFIETVSHREHLWIAEIEGDFAGSVAIVRNDDLTAQLRWLIVEPDQRKKGLGRQLVAQAVRFSREKGYRTVMLWTIDFLHAARHIYQDTGFRLKQTKASQVWGRRLTEECWMLELE